jgi:hypothetical protein
MNIAGQSFFTYNEYRMAESKHTCNCGTTAGQANVYARGIYRRHDRVLLALGATRRPVKVEIRCTR